MQWALLENKNVTPTLKRSTTSVISRCRSPATFPTFFFTFQRLSNFSIISFLLLPFQRLSSPPSPQQQQSHVTGSNCVSMLLHGRITILKSRLLKPGAIALWRLRSTLSTPQTAKQRCVQFDDSPTKNPTRRGFLRRTDQVKTFISSQRLYLPAILSSTDTTRYSFFPHCSLCLGRLLLVAWSPVTCALVTCYLWHGHLLLVPWSPVTYGRKDCTWNIFTTSGTLSLEFTRFQVIPV